MKATDDPNIFHTKGGIFFCIVTATIGTTAAVAVISDAMDQGNRGKLLFFVGFLLSQSFMLVSSIGKASRSFVVSRMGRSVAQRSNIFLTMPGLIIGTISGTVSSSIFIIALDSAIRKGDTLLIALDSIMLVCMLWSLVSLLRNVHRFVHKKQLAYENPAHG